MTTRPEIEAVALRLSARLKRVGAFEFAGPCLICGGTDRFGINTKKNVWNCRGCGVGGDPIALVRHVNGFTYPEAIAFLGLDRNAPRRPSEARRRPFATGLKDGQPQREHGRRTRPVGRGRRSPRNAGYLSSRDLELGDDIAGDVLRWHPGVGAMLALFRDIRTDKPRAVSRTFLSREGAKLGRKFLGPVKGSAIKLDADETVLVSIHVGEGAESCQAARQLGLKPCWALGSAPAVASFPVLNIEALSILREHDEANAKAAIACGTRWKAAGREVFDVWPNAGNDVNDAIREVEP